MISILLIIIGIGGLIFVHELGHFLTAKLSGVKVEVFSVGFGWKFLSFKWGETQYALSAIPLGGYVKMAGELPNEERTGAEYELHSKSAWKRFWIFSAGSLMNLLVVFPICILMFWIGVDQVGNEIGELRPGSPEWNAGIEPGHKLVGLRVQKTPGPVNGSSEEWGPVKDVRSLSAYRETLIGLSADQHVKMMVSGNQSDQVKEYVVDPEDPIEQGQNVLPPGNVVRHVVDRSAADHAGIRPEDQLLSINGHSVRSTRDIRRVVEQHVDPKIRYVVKRGNGDTEIHELAVPQGAPYLMNLDGQHVPVYRPTEDLNIRDQFDLSSNDRIVRVNHTLIASPSDPAASALYDGPLPLSDLSFVRAPSGPVSVRLKRRSEDSISTKTLDVYPTVTNRPDPMTSLVLKPEISSVRSGSPAERAGLRKGDLIKEIDGASVTSYYDLSLWLKDRGGDKLALTYERDGKEQTTNVVPRENAFGEGEIGIMINLGQAPAPLPELPKTSGFASSGFQQGDRIVALYTKDGKRKQLSADEGNNEGGVRLLQRYATASPNGLTVEVRREENGEETTTKRTYIPRTTRSGLVGVEMKPEMFTERLGLIPGIRSGISRGGELYVLTMLGIQKMFQSSEAASEGLSGPVRIASISYRAAEQDVGQFLKLLAMISISLGVLNLLPLPPLDGGHILFLFIEVLRGEPLGEETLYKIQLLGFLFFIGLFILITYNDIVNLMG